MRSKAKLSIILMIMISGIIVGGILYAQADKPEGGSTAGAGKDDKINFILDDEAKTSRDLLGKDVSKALYKVMLDTFEESGEWYSS
ncbi:MAG: hypothetical protein OEV44_13040, partial [Spirochaetota bacterium]|nr:hypothetical protein [Spirochaetota bacterium]